MRFFLYAVGLAFAIGWAPPGLAQPALGLPVDCTYGETCFIQNYYDHDAGPGRLDYACGRLSYDGHDGTDFRTRDVVTMREGMPVVAAADGTVRAVRDGMDDIRLSEIGREQVAGREAGNGVVIVHGDGWETQYSHLRNGSVAVAPGDRVVAGQRLGLIGMSGAAEFPHVEFSVRRNGEDIDPFTGPVSAYACSDARTSLWRPDVDEMLEYHRTGLLVAGFSETVPVADAARDGAHRLPQTANDPDILIFWVDLFGAETGDVEQFVITAPDGTPVLEHGKPLEDNNVSWFSYAGLRRPEAGWRPGTYTARYTLDRDGVPVVDHDQSITISSSD